MRLINKRVVVTGGAGMIGSFVVERLLALGAEVVVADDFSKGLRSHLAGVIDRITVSEGDLERLDMMERALEGAEFVFHLASRAFGVGYSSTHHLAMLQHNERITNNLLDVLMRKPVEHLLVASSSCVYSDVGPDTMPESPLFSGEPELANWGYGWAKRFLEQKVAILARETGIAVTVVRPFNIYAERYRWLGDGSQAIPMLVKKVMDGDNPVTIWGSGTQRRNYLHAADCADAMVGLIETGFVGTVNIGTEDTVKLTELVEAICRRSGRKPLLINDLTKPEGRRVKSCDSTLLRKVYPDFRVRIGLEEGLERMIGWYHSTFDTAAQ